MVCSELGFAWIQLFLHCLCVSLCAAFSSLFGYLFQPLTSDQWNAHQRGYAIRYAASTPHIANLDYQFIHIDMENASSYVLHDLNSWVEYQVQLAAVNEVGMSNYSQVAECKTKESGN